MDTKHAVLWIDHQHATLVRLREKSHDAVSIPGPTGHQTHNKHHDDGHRHPIEAEYADRIAAALAGIEEILIVGPGSAKDELRARLDSHHRDVAGRVIAIESSDRVTEGELADHARRFFVKADRMRGEHVR